MTASLDDVRSFWERSPLASADINAEPGTPEFFAAFDAIREAEDCEPAWLQERVYRLARAAGKHVLDIGCGNGYVLSRFAGAGATVHGVDITDRSIEISRRRFSEMNLRGDFTRIDGQRLPFEDCSFDVVTSMGVLHHVPDPNPLVSEACRVLKPGGEMIIMLYYRYSWQYQVLMRAKRLALSSHRGRSQAEAVNMVDGTENPLGRVYSRPAARALLERAGLTTSFCEVHQISWRQLLLAPPLVKLAEAVLP
ncbi:MAG: methyltransferase domain-containing protein, partial [Proteobacteria bacterium]|nr:methyltransferase domain-containing protein [Pseudomonadota bacterium]